MQSPCDPASHWFLTGATATGKTGVGVELARRLGAEIVSLDSMAVYRGMDIGTAKPSPAQRDEVPHHLIDLVEVDEEYSVARYVDDAQTVIQKIEHAGRKVLFVGGTPLYLKAMLRGLFDGPQADWSFRQAVEDELRLVGQPALYERLQAVDPVSASKLHPNDTRRLIRALEVYRATGEPISHLQMEFDEGLPAEACRVFVLTRPREELCERIHQRTTDMLSGGLIDEVQRLLDSPRQLGRTASKAVGYQEVIEHLTAKLPLVEVERRIDARTRRFAKRQATWFRSLSECRFIEVLPDEPDGAIAERILAEGLRGREPRV